MATTAPTTAPPATPSKPPTAGLPPTQEMSRWRRNILLASLFTGAFMSFLDTTIVSVALPTIVNDFGSYTHSAWALTAYLLTYMAFGIIISRLGDIFGRRTMQIVSLVLFLAFSIGCALSQSMTQLIIFRAFQGIGGSGLYSMCIIIGVASVTPAQRNVVSGAIGLVLAFSGILGPVLSGAITDNGNSSTWRWIFWLNIPVGGVTMVAFVLSYPGDKAIKRPTLRMLAGIDYFGALLLLAFSVLLIFALQEAGAYFYAWNSPAIIVSLVLSSVCFIVFVLWEVVLSRRPKWIVKQIFPIQVVTRRVVACIMFVTMITGATYYTGVFYLPQRFQIVDGNSPLISGLKLIPMLVCSAVSSIVAGRLNKNWNCMTYSFMIATACQVLGYGLMSMYGDSVSSPAGILGIEVFLGFGFGIAMPTATIGIQLYVEPKWIAASQGALTQFRSLGGTLGLAAGVIITNVRIQSSSSLRSALTSAQLTALEESPLVLSTFSSADRVLAASVFSAAFTEEMRIACYLGVAGFVAACLSWERNPPLPLAKRVPAAPAPAPASAASAAVEETKDDRAATPDDADEIEKSDDSIKASHPSEEDVVEKHSADNPSGDV